MDPKKLLWMFVILVSMPLAFATPSVENVSIDVPLYFDENAICDYDFVGGGFRFVGVEWFINGILFNTSGYGTEVENYADQVIYDNRTTGYAGEFLDFYDGNWSSYAYFQNDNIFLNATYEKPENATSTSLWQVKDYCGTANLSIPADCWNYNSTHLYFQVQPSTFFGTPQTEWRCIEVGGVVSNPLRTCSNNPSGRFMYEEAMYWNVSHESSFVYAENASFYNNTYFPTPETSPGIENITDGNWTTSGQLSDTTLSLVYNKTKGASNNTVWRLSYNGLVDDYYIPQSCWDYNESQLYLSIFARADAWNYVITTFRCQNSTGHENVFNHRCSTPGVLCTNLSEEAVVWHYDSNVLQDNAFNIGEKIGCEITPGNSTTFNGSIFTYGTKVNSSNVTVLPHDPTITVFSKTTYDQQVGINNLYAIPIKMAQNHEQNVTYNITHTFNTSKFNISFSESSVYMQGVSSTTIDMNLTPLSTLYDGEIINKTVVFRETLSNATFNLSLNLIVSNSSALIRFNPVSSWSASTHNTDTLIKSFYLENTGIGSAANCEFVSSGSLESYFSHEAFSVGVGENSTVELTVTRPSAGSYIQDIQVKCGNVYTTNSVLTVFSILSAPVAGGGGDPVIKKIKCDVSVTENVYLSNNDKVGLLVIQNSEVTSYSPNFKLSAEGLKYLDLAGINKVISPNGKNDVVIRLSQDINESKELDIVLTHSTCKDITSKVYLTKSGRPVESFLGFFSLKIKQINLPEGVTLNVTGWMVTILVFFVVLAAVFVGLHAMKSTVNIPGKIGLSLLLTLFATIGVSYLIQVVL